MQEIWKLLSSPRHIVFFEAAARHRSFTRAAAELNVQQPAVSAAMKQLEASLGVTLFQRSHKRVDLTLAGEKLFADISTGLETIKASAREISQRGERRHVTLSASTAFAHYWMVPRLSGLHERHPEIDLRLQTSDREPDIDAEGLTLAIRRGVGDWQDVEAAPIAVERIYPIASAQQDNGLRGLTDVSALLETKLLHLEEPIRERPGWEDYFAHFGISNPIPNSGLRLNDYALVLQAAIAGEGISFGWHHVVHRLIDQGIIVARNDWVWETGSGFYLVWSKSNPLDEHGQKVRDWILEMAEQR